MATILLSYDLANKHSEVKNEMLSKPGYTDKWFDTTNKNHQLPNTTLFYTGLQTELQVWEDLKSVCIKHGATLERGIAAVCSTWCGF
jgi:hypothetical protein